MTLAAASENRLQFVPIWNGMTMPETTPMPNDTANILIQKRRDAEVDLAAGGEMEALQDRYEGCEADGEGRQEEMKGDDPGELHPGKHNRIQAHLDALSLRPPRPRFGRGVTVSRTVTISMTLLGGLPPPTNQA